MKYLRFTDPTGNLNGEVEINRGDKLTIKVGDVLHSSHKPKRGLISLIGNEILLPPYQSDVRLFKFAKEGTELSRIEYLGDRVVLRPLIDGVQHVQIRVGNFISRPFLGDKRYSPKDLPSNTQFSVPLSSGRDLYVIKILEFAGFILTDKPIVNDTNVKKDLRDYFKTINQEDYS